MPHAAYKMLMALTFAAILCTWLAAMGEAADRYTTQRGDTLWEIAGRYVPDDTISTQEMMVALYDANPEAFLENNINLLKIGYALRIPTREELGVPPAPPEPPVPAADTPLEPPVEAAAAGDSEVTPTVSAQDMTELRSELAQTQAQATRQLSENEALRAQVAALEARVMQLHDLVAPPPDASVEPQLSPTPPRLPSRTATWFTVSNMMLVSAMLVLGLALIWWWVRRTTANTAAAETVASVTPQAHAEQPATEAADPMSLGLGDLEMETGIEAVTDATLAALMIDLDDLELEPAQTGEETPGLSSTASISPKADSASPPNSC